MTYKRRARQLHRALFLLFLGIGTVGCRPYLFSYGDGARDLAAANQMVERHYNGQFFILTAFERISKKGSNFLTIYIEGDGNSWTNRGPSLDPTPKNPIALELAVKDPSDAVVYLARPCQYTVEWPSRNCETRYWTSHRFSKEAVAATNSVISQLKERARTKKIRLVGFSGGGAIAALVAAEREDLESLITVAGTLDHEIWTRHHDVTPLYGSLNPIHKIDKLAKIPQVHFSGTEDKVVPRLVMESYISKYLSSARVRSVVYKTLDHTCCWGEHWPHLLKTAEKKLSGS